MTPAETTWVETAVLRPRLGARALRQPHHMGQAECLHLARDTCPGCRLGYHGVCSGWVWPELYETWICDSHGSWLYWDDDCHYLVWTPPRRCSCGFPPRRYQPPEPAAARPVQPSLFELEVSQ